MRCTLLAIANVFNLKVPLPPPPPDQLRCAKGVCVNVCAGGACASVRALEGRVRQCERWRGVCVSVCAGGACVSV